MALVQKTVSLKLRDGEWKALGISDVQASSVSCPTLVEGLDFEVEYAGGRVRRLRTVADGLHAFTVTHENRAEALAAELSERTIALADLKDNYTAAINRLDQIRTQMAAIAVATFANNTARDAAIKQIAAGVDDEALIVKRTLRLIRSTV